MYGEAFRTQVRAGAQSSAAALVPLLVDTFRPASMIDVGCGEGWWAQAFANHGCTAAGVDLGCDNRAGLDRYTTHDLEQPLADSLGTFDLALSLEVAEHLTPGRATTFVADLCALAPVVVFSAAIPGQRGVGHRNEQYQTYWARLFDANQFAVSGSLRTQIWDDTRIDRWYRQNLLVATTRPERYRQLFPDGAPLDLVHPEIFVEHHR